MQKQIKIIINNYLTNNTINKNKIKNKIYLFKNMIKKLNNIKY